MTSKSCTIESLEARRLLAWGPYPQLIQQDQAVFNFPAITGKNVNIALIDSGVDLNQTYLQGKFWSNPGEIAGDGIDNDSSGYIDDTVGWDFFRNDKTPEDENGHGTALAGIIAANQFTHNGATYKGIAPEAKIIPLKVSDPTGGYNLLFAQNVEKALKWVETNHARYNIKIVSMSVRTPDADYFAIYDDEVARLAAAGVMLIAAGGQTDPNADVHYPAADANVYAISAVNVADQFSNIVNRGPGIDLLAPGGGYPILLRGGGFSTSFEATSYSVPFASATAALIRQIYPSFTSAQIMSIMNDSGENVTDTTTQFTHSGGTYKRLNVWEALKLANQRMPSTVPQAPYAGTPFAAAQTVQAENFDNGGEGVSFHDTDSSNVLTKYRVTAVDVGTSTDSGNGSYVGNTRVGEWLEYSFKLKKSSNYDLNLRLAMLGKGARIHVEWDGVDKTGQIAVPNSGGWQNWRTITHNAIALGSGNHTLRIFIDKGNGGGDGPNLNWFSLTPAGAYSSSDIGSPSILGTTATVTANSAYDVTAAGAGIGSTSDQFRFLHKQITGDFDIKVRVESLSLTSVWAKAGLMARESLAANSRNVFAFATPTTNGYKFQTRSATGGKTAIGGKGGVTYPNVWLRLKRVGNTFTAYRGTNGSTWTQYAAATMALPSTLFVGMAATSTYTKGATIAKFRNLV